MHNDQNLLEIRKVTKFFDYRKGALRRAAGSLRAVNDVSISLKGGQILGLVGESGCGKTTLAKLIVGLEKPSSGQIWYLGKELSEKTQASQNIRRQIQLVFQDPASSLDPTQKAASTLIEPLMAHRLVKSREDKISRLEYLLSQVGLPFSYAKRYPNQLSGGEKQRLAIARALSLEPKVLVLDEPVASLDIYIGMQVLELLKKLHEKSGLAYILISHDLRVIGSMCHDVAVMYLGSIVELGPASAVFKYALHPYTELLLESAGLRTAGIEDRGEIPSPISPPSGCAFRTRCPIAEDMCRLKVPALEEKRSGHMAACHFRH